MDWFSYLLGVITLPTLVVAVFLGRVLLSRWIGGTTPLRHLSGPSNAPAPLQFNQRIFGKLRHPTEAERPTARAS